MDMLPAPDADGAMVLKGRPETSAPASLGETVVVLTNELATLELDEELELEDEDDDFSSSEDSEED